MKATEILDNVKELLKLSREELKVEDVVIEDSVELSTEEVKEEVEETVLAEEEVVEESKKEVVEDEVSMKYATAEDLSALKSEILSMINQLIEDKPMGDMKEVPEELSKQEEVELSEEVEEVVHSPENAIQEKKNLLSKPNRPMTTQERVNRMLFN